jgi:hypothetical protein
MSLLGDFLKSFSKASVELLTASLKDVGASVVSSEKDDLLKATTVEMLSIGVEDLLDKCGAGMRAQLSKKPLTQEELEAVVKKDIYAFLESLSSDLVVELSKAVGIASVSDADNARLKLFEEIVLLGAEGFLDLQEEKTLSSLCQLLGLAAPGNKLQQVEALMVHIFSLKSVPEKKGGGSARRKANVKGKEAEPPQKKQKQPTFSSKSEVSKLKVGELRAFCEAEGLSTEGLKPDLVDRVWAAQKK